VKKEVVVCIRWWLKVGHDLNGDGWLWTEFAQSVFHGLLICSAVIVVRDVDEIPFLEEVPQCSDLLFRWASRSLAFVLAGAQNQPLMGAPKPAILRRG
jgi:hypothetical protein